MEVSLSCVILVGKILDKNIYKKCLKSVSWCDEIIKIDTSKIKGSFSQWRNEGLKKTKSEWVLYIDIDEVVGTDLRQEILDLVKRNQLLGCFAIPRRNFIFGKEFKYSGQYPDYQKRLFKRSLLKGWINDVHEEPIFIGKLNHLKNPILHYKNISISQMIDKTNEWSEIEAKLMFDAKHPQMNIIRFMSAGFREFWLRFVKQKAYMDGGKGIIYGIYQVYSKLISYSKLWEKQQYIIRT